MSPFTAYLQLTGLETLAQRIATEVKTAEALARHLLTVPQVEQVNYSGIPECRHQGDGDQQDRLASTLLPKGVGTILSFKVQGGYEQVKRIVDSVRLMSYMPNIGDCRTLIVDPARITHREVPGPYRLSAGVGDDLIRISVGLENPDDLIADLDQAFAAAYPKTL